MNLSTSMRDKKIIVCCGSGGVGKTTLAASIALWAAKNGRKTIVLTIDPAKRLATALGLDTLGLEPQIVRGTAGGAPLYAMMLDTKRAFDRLIEKYAVSSTAQKTILENRLYQHLSSMISGSQEYMAMEQLYELFRRQEFDLIVLDTPPTRHALDFLEAPQKMIQLVSHSALKWFLKPGIFASRVGFGMLQKGAKIFHVFDKLAGFEFLKELSEMLALMEGLLGGFHDRAESVYELLRQEIVGFLLVTSTSSVAIQDALYFYRQMSDRDLPFLGFIVNRVLAGVSDSSSKRLASLSAELRSRVLSVLDQYQQLADRDREAIALLKKMGGKKNYYFTIPFFSEDVHDLEGLLKVSEALFQA
ncbi:MAG: ArsA family ATPase [Deltaproteobacteria bacterium]|nr:ArsA family ATPase [Deltaproteobacteria bacterium]